MNVGILTYFNVNNQGAQLQMYALYHQIKKMGFNPKILSYIKNYDFKKECEVKYQISLRSIPYYIKHYLFGRGISSTRFNYLKYKKNKKFRLNNFTIEEYQKADIDCAIIGSDEVWSIEFGFNKMLYGHGIPTQFLISYAPSFGQTNLQVINEYGCRESISSGLRQFSRLSCRDLHTQKLVKELIGIDIQIVCDPVLLYDFSQTTMTVKLPRAPYLLIYAYEDNLNRQEEVMAICSYAKQNGLLTVSAGTYHKWCDYSIPCNCLQWVEYFRNADQIVTDTFHGTIVSIITGKPMAVMVRNSNSYKLTDLLEQTGLENRRLESITLSELNRVFSQPIDFKILTDRIKEMRWKGEEYLADSLAFCTEGVAIK